MQDDLIFSPSVNKNFSVYFMCIGEVQNISREINLKLKRTEIEGKKTVFPRVWKASSKL